MPRQLKETQIGVRKRICLIGKGSISRGLVMLVGYFKVRDDGKYVNRQIDPIDNHECQAADRHRLLPRT